MQESSMAELSVICLFAFKQISEKPGASSSFNLYFWNWICNKGDPHSACIFFLPIFTLYFNSTYPTTKDTNIQTKIKTNKQTNKQTNSVMYYFYTSKRPCLFILPDACSVSNLNTLP